MTRAFLALPLVIGCQAADLSSETSTTDLNLPQDSEALYAVEGGYRGDLTSMGMTDPVGLDDRELVVVVSLLEVNGSHGLLDVSVRPGMGHWMIGRGDVELEGEQSGLISVDVSDGIDTHCTLEGTWFGNEELVEMSMDCTNNEHQTSEYATVVGSF